MTKFAGPTVEILLRRIREQGGSAISPDFALGILSKCQRLINTGLRKVIKSVTLPTAARQLLYTYRTLLSDAIDIISLEDGIRTLTKCDNLSELSAFSNTWFRDTGSQHNTWCQIGRDLLIIYPARTANSSLTAHYSTLTTDLTSFSGQYNTDLQLPDDDVELALAMSEIILLIHLRKTDVTDKRMKQFQETLKPFLIERGLK